VTDVVFHLIQFNADGSRDTSFGVGGLASAAGISGGGVNSMVLQPDGAIVVIGWEFSHPPSPFGGAEGALRLIRYKEDGTIDSGFGAAGRASLEKVPGSVFSVSAVLQTDRKIVVASSVG